MSALPENVVRFAIPKRPKVREKEAPPDQRKVCVLPFRAVADKNLTDGGLRVLAAVCSYCNRAGITWVSQAKVASDLRVSQQAISKHVKLLVSLGYVEIVRKGFRGERSNTIRVIFDPTVDAETAIAITSAQENTRPPTMDDTPDPAGQARIASLIAKALKSPPTRSKTMPKSGETRTVKEMKQAIQKAQSKRPKPVDKPVDNHQSIGHSPVSYESFPEAQKDALHRQPIGHSTVSYNSEEHIRESIKEDSFKELKTVLHNSEVDELIAGGLTVEQIADSLDTLLPLYAAEGIEPSSAILAEGIRQLQADAR